MTNRIDYEYYEWLVSEIRVPRNKTYNDLFNRMHNLEFVWTVPHDDNRLQDGLDLRVEFLNGATSRLTLNAATTLEVLVALSRRLAFTAGGEAPYWAWQLVKNLKLAKAHDPWTERKAQSVEEILERLIWRQYQYDGSGGFFPLQYPKEDQTRVEIWYQMQAYVIEMSD